MWLFVFLQNKKQLYALVCETLKYRPIIDEILNETKIRQQENNLDNIYLAEVLVYDFLFGKGIDRSYQQKARILIYTLYFILLIYNEGYVYLCF